ncbi:aminotransferase class V-fold PLP-dependent enzyme [Candidatus Mancarchaeum acidiphilum]|uniref:aminotransferase class V-fold PLP-dependent enzyme n=1 Tax=Candidatus Mancarchaeum acidiphilum TaxID=1920749 RepID=UPI000F5489C4|nr:SufS family cysteine desulfurase [Candidatus Mancarchaeum acidiphilum]
MNAGDIKKDFPIFKIKMSGKPIVYLDSAATSQKPKQVIDSIVKFYSEYNANIHRGIYDIAERATDEYTNSKGKLAKLIGAKSIRNIVYVRNTTEAINLVALSWGNANIEKGDHILISDMEHHSNLVPWQLLAKRKGAVLDYIKLDKSSEKLDMDSFKENLENDPKMVAVTQASNVLGTINDVKYITKEAKKHGSVVLVDGAQSAPHMPVDVQSIGCDFFALSAHKMLGPTGIGALYGTEEILNSMEPLFGGGDMISAVTRQTHSWNSLPWKFEAGTSNIEGGIAFGAAIDYLNSIGMEKIRRHEEKLTKHALESLENVKNIEVYGPKKDEINIKSGVVSFGIKGVHPHDVAQIFNNEGIAIRAGHHCAMPLVTEVLRQGAVSRMSFYLYNDEDDIDKAVAAIDEVKRIFKLE